MIEINKKAHTLMETIVSVAIFIAILGAIYSSFLIAQKSMNISSNVVEPKQQLRRAVISMVGELREASNLFTTKDDHSFKLTFQHPTYGEVQYSWDSKGDDAGAIVRTNYTNKRILAHDISNLNITQELNNAVEIEVSIGKDKDTTLKQKVALRPQTGLFAQSANEKIK